MADAMPRRGGDRGRSRAPGSAKSSESGRNGARRSKPRGPLGGTARGDAVRAENGHDLDWRRRDPPPRNDDRTQPMASSLAKSDSASLMQRGPVVGECLAMCSPAEVQSRQQIKDISRFETPTDTKQYASWAVKKYRRPAAGRIDIDALDLRPSHVLLETLQHLFTNVLPWPGHGFDWDSTHKLPTSSISVHDFLGLYHFLSDRLRAVRQDFVVQRVRDQSRVVALVQIARFYVVASFRALQVIADATDKTLDWSETLNDQQLASALTEVHALYPSAAHDLGNGTRFHEEAVALDVLLHLRDPRAVSLLLLKTPSPLRHSDSLQRVLALFVAFHTSDAIRFVRLIRELPAVQQCLAQRHYPMVWAMTMRHMNKAFGKMDRFALSKIADKVGLPSGDDARLLCMAMNIHIDDEMSTALLDSDDWEDETSTNTGYAKFKTNAIRDELDAEQEQKLLCRQAVAIQKELLEKSTATAFVMES